MRIFFYSVFILLLAACGGSGSAKRLDTLDEAVNHYGQALRWGRYEDAEAFHMSREGQRAMFKAENLESIRITGYSVRERTLSEDLLEADVSGDYSYYSTSYGTLRHVSFQQKWWYDEEAKRWFVEGELPEFK